MYGDYLETEERNQNIPCLTPFFYFPPFYFDNELSILKQLFPLLLEEIESENSFGKDVMTITSENGTEVRFRESILRVRYLRIY